MHFHALIRCSATVIYEYGHIITPSQVENVARVDDIQCIYKSSSSSEPIPIRPRLLLLFHFIYNDWIIHRNSAVSHQDLQSDIWFQAFFFHLFVDVLEFTSGFWSLLPENRVRIFEFAHCIDWTFIGLETSLSSFIISPVIMIIMNTLLFPRNCVSTSLS